MVTKMSKQVNIQAMIYAHERSVQSTLKCHHKTLTRSTTRLHLHLPGSSSLFSINFDWNPSVFWASE